MNGLPAEEILSRRHWLATYGQRIPAENQSRRLWFGAGDARTVSLDNAQQFGSFDARALGASPDLKIKNSDKISREYQLRERSVNKYLRWHDQKHQIARTEAERDELANKVEP